MEAAKCGVRQFHAIAEKDKTLAWPSVSQLKKGGSLDSRVALMDKVCRRIDLLRALKLRFPKVGVIRVKMSGQCREYVRDRSGDKDFALATPAPVNISIATPHESDGE